ncbi:hypothetical protein PCE1_001956 [Barthelona sp. PCE]
MQHGYQPGFDPRGIAQNYITSSGMPFQQRMNALFAAADIQRDGFLSVTEVQRSFAQGASAVSISIEASKSLMRLFDSPNAPGQGVIDQSEFIMLNAFVESLRMVYANYAGNISAPAMNAQSMQPALASLGLVLTPVSVQNLVRIFASSNPTVVTYLQFLEICIHTALCLSLHTRFAGGSERASLSADQMLAFSLFFK